MPIRPKKPKVGREKEDRPHPGLLPQEKESLFQRLENRDALSWRWFGAQWVSERIGSPLLRRANAE